MNTVIEAVQPITATILYTVTKFNKKLSEVYLLAAMARVSLICLIERINDSEVL